MIKLLHGADLHLGSSFHSAGPDKAPILRHRQDRIPELLLRLCREECCDLVLLAGDLFDSPEPPSYLTDALKESLRAMGVPVFIAPGNHDYVCRKGPYLSQWPENVHIFTSPVLESLALPELDARIWGAGFTSMDCPGLLESFHAFGKESFQIGILHGDPIDSKSPCCPVTQKQVENSGLSYLALGHIHKAGRLNAGSTLCAWPGCPMGRGFDETGSKGVFLVQFEKAQAPQLQFIDLGLGTFEEISCDLTGGQVSLSALPRDSGDTVCRLTLTGQCTRPDTERLYAQLAPRFFHLVLRDETVRPSALWENAGSDSLEGLYFQLLQKGTQSSDPETAQLYTMAAKLSRMILDGQEVHLP